jgi:hypothetical protein
MGRRFAEKVVTLMVLGTVVGVLAGQFPETKQIFNLNKLDIYIMIQCTQHGLSIVEILLINFY